MQLLEYGFVVLQGLIPCHAILVMLSVSKLAFMQVEIFPFRFAQGQNDTKPTLCAAVLRGNFKGFLAKVKGVT
ncbi:hypothetical protein [Helicobacter bilis]|uniref:hypothetical protein n=1 Tax=Helicobacter bilis TaxID=37372 RepID=UPI001C2CA3D6|nr:hypothetical protein [Helicobacter bilis]